MKHFLLLLTIFCSFQLHSTDQLNNAELEIAEKQSSLYRHAAVTAVSYFESCNPILCLRVCSPATIPYSAVIGGVVTQLLYPTGYSGAKFSAFCDAAALATSLAGYNDIATGLIVTKWFVDVSVGFSKIAQFMSAVKKQRSAKKLKRD